MSGWKKQRGRGEPGPDLKDATRGERLQRVMADAGVASRRDCERLIEDGCVEVNGSVVTELPAWVDAEADRIVVNGRVLPGRSRLIYVLLNKPPRVLTAARDEPGADRTTVVDLVKYPGDVTLFPVGRLDFETTGLVILTNDGEMANRLTHPRYGVPKHYRAVVKGQMGEAAARELEAGIKLTDRRDGKTVGASKTMPVGVRVVHVERDRTVVDVTLYEGRNRQVRRMLAAIGHEVKSLERRGMGPLQLKGVARGSWRELTAAEVRALRRATAMGGGKQ